MLNLESICLFIGQCESKRNRLSTEFTNALGLFVWNFTNYLLVILFNIVDAQFLVINSCFVLLLRSTFNSIPNGAGLNIEFTNAPCRFERCVTRVVAWCVVCIYLFSWLQGAVGRVSHILWDYYIGLCGKMLYLVTRDDLSKKSSWFSLHLMDVCLTPMRRHKFSVFPNNFKLVTLMKLELGLKRVEWGAALFCEPWKLHRRFGKAQTIENRPATT